MDLRQLTTTNDEPQELICSAKGCRASATHAIRWNNPKLHEPARRKVWLACDAHEETLRDFLSMRGFYRDTVDPDELSPHDG